MPGSETKARLADWSIHTSQHGRSLASERHSEYHILRPILPVSQVGVQGAALPQLPESMRSRKSIVIGLVWAVASLVIQTGTGQERAQPAEHAGRIDFSERIAPIFEQKCQVCHGAALQSGGLRLDNAESALKGGYSGPVIVPGDSGASRLIRLISGTVEDLVMPPSGDRLSQAEVRLLETWVDQGADWPRDATHASKAKQDTNHWAFRPVTKGDPPPVRRESWVRNSIDRFVLARLEEEGIEPSPRAGLETLVRRVSLDLTGLPPSRRAVEAFIKDPSAAAYERLVDDLLESPHYGERWAMHWLDLARYADSDGYEKDSERPYAWRWRQWVVDALKPRHAVRPVHRGPNRRRRDTRVHLGPAGRYRVPSQRAEESRGRGQNRAIPVRGNGRPRKHDRDRLAWAHDRLRAMPRPQVRPHLARRLLPIVRLHECCGRGRDRRTHARRNGTVPEVAARLPRASPGTPTCEPRLRTSTPHGKRRWS